MDTKQFFIKSPLIPAIIQEKGTNEVLMLAYMNEESLKKTLETGYTWFFSRSRNELWNKGATSGHVQKVVSITPDCDDDTLLIVVEQTGPACHTGNKTCFYQDAIMDNRTGNCSESRSSSSEDQKSMNEDAMQELYQVVVGRQKNHSENSYTCYLFEKGLDKILKKCGEECSEIIIAAKNTAIASSQEEKEQALTDVKNEICDLLYHLTVLMVNEGIELDGINAILKERSLKIGNKKQFHVSDHNS